MEKKVEKFGRPAPEIEGLVAATGLSPLITCSLDTGDRGLMSTFMERWHKKISSFHPSVGEVTITLDDVASLLHFPITDAFHTFEPLHVDDVILLLVKFLEVSAEKVRAETVQCHGAYVRTIPWGICLTILATRPQAYLLHLLGCTLFANKSATHVHVSGSYALGAVALVHMYDNLNDASKSTARQLAGYITLLHRKPRAYHWKSGKTLPISTYRGRLDRLTSDIVCWIPYGDHRAFREFEVISLFFRHIICCLFIVIHRPKMDVRQFGYVQTIPPHHAAHSLCIEDIDDRWIQFSGYIAPVGQICVTPNQCSPNYMDWFYLISHPFMSPA
ncbi:Protein MAIN-LIKE 1 [Glycine max]|nr:Protein MAIN-LIKE 1 [Glycine max]